MARVKAFRASYGMTAEIKGVYHKFHAELEVEIDAEDDAADVRKRTWNTVQVEVEKQIKDVLDVQ